jgi:hypothetical protein
MVCPYLAETSSYQGLRYPIAAFQFNTFCPLQNIAALRPGIVILGTFVDNAGLDCGLNWVCSHHHYITHMMSCSCPFTYIITNLDFNSFPSTKPN